MVKWLPILSRRQGPRPLLAAVLLFAALASRAQQGNSPVPPFPGDAPFTPRVHKPPKPPKFADQFPENPNLPPAFTIPLRPLGFSAPGAVYLLRRQALVSLDFLDENRLLFSFQVPSGLVRREGEDAAADTGRHIRAVVVELPDGKIESDALWVVPDLSRYLWMLKDGHFLLRDSDGLEQGDAALKITPFLRMPGSLLWLSMDPAQKVLMTNSLEPAEAAQESGETSLPVTGSAPITSDGQKPEAQQTLVTRTFQRESGQLIKTTRVPFAAQTRDWPINSDGYLESSRDKSGQWLLTLNDFAGGSKVVTHVDSTCKPTSDYVSENELLVTTCEPKSGERLLGMSADGTQLWQVRTSSNEMSPLVVNSPDGSRVARETLLLKRFTNQYKRLVGARDLEGQMLRVYSAADGNMVLEAPLSPTLDGGGNVAISPSGRRVAILNAGAIQVFDLPAPTRTLLPKPGPDPSPH
jgi:hypothetical protein